MSCYQHPFASYCQKVLIALYELDVPFDSHLVEGAEGRAELARLWPMAGIPVLRDEEADLTLPESTTIIEYLDSLAAGGPVLVPPTRPSAAGPPVGPLRRPVPLDADAEDRRRRAATRGPRRPRGRGRGAAPARHRLRRPRRPARGRPWAGGKSFTVADCATFPTLFYLRAIHRWDTDAHANITRYYRDAPRPPLDHPGRGGGPPLPGPLPAAVAAGPGRAFEPVAMEPIRIKTNVLLEDAEKTMALGAGDASEAGVRARASLTWESSASSLVVFRTISSSPSRRSTGPGRLPPRLPGERAPGRLRALLQPDLHDLQIVAVWSSSSHSSSICDNDRLPQSRGGGETRP